MAYTKKTWVSGETPLSAENMNNIENGIANAHEDISELNTKTNTINPAVNTLQSTVSGAGRVSLTINDGVGIADFEIEQSRILRLAISETGLTMQFVDYKTGTNKTKTIAQFD